MKCLLNKYEVRNRVATSGIADLDSGLQAIKKDSKVESSTRLF
jgi:hypothetical protein